MADRDAAAAAGMDGAAGLPAPLQATIELAWQQVYLDPHRALALGHQLTGCGHAPAAAFGWLHVALAEVRVGDAAIAADALLRARRGFAEAAERRGLALCDEVQAIALRRAGEYGASQALQADIDRREGIAWTEHDRFLAHNSRAITHKLLGHADTALRHFYDALAAARRSGSGGAVVTALGNLGGYHQDLYNLEDARELCEQALQAARALGARQSVGVAAANLISIYHAMGLPERSRAMADFLLTHPQELLPGALDRFPMEMAMAAMDAGDVAAAQRYLDGGAVSLAGDGDGLAMWTWLQARCWLACDEPAAALQLLEQTFAARRAARITDPPNDLLQMLRAAADAAERIGDMAAALRHTRHAQTVYEDLVGRSARARFIALQVSHDLQAAQRERDLAQHSHRLADDDRRRLVELNRALQAQIAETEALHLQLREQALRDPLTGLNNRRHFYDVAPGMVELARRQGRVLSLVLMDLDHFKAVNDTFGHQTGDAVLQRFAQLLAQTLRRSDVICRHGGEEFVALMPDVELDGAHATLERLQAACRRVQEDADGGSLPLISFSAGIAVFPSHGGAIDPLMTRADRALYVAKAAGRARIEPARLSEFGVL